MTSVLRALGLAALLVLGGEGARAEMERLPPRQGFDLGYAVSRSPLFGLRYATVSYVRDWDHGSVWRNDGPPALRFRLETTAGLARVPMTRFLGCVNVIAVRYIDFLSGPMLRPYVEGGIGLSYTDFRVRGQGLRFNFDPQFGAGLEIQAAPDVAFHVDARWHHMSNAGLNHENRGINAVWVTTGLLFR